MNKNYLIWFVLSLILIISVQATTITINSPEGILTGPRDEILKNYQLPMKGYYEDIRFFSPDHSPIEWGTVWFAKDDGNVKVNFNKKVNLEFKNPPNDFGFQIGSEEQTCFTEEIPEHLQSDDDEEDGLSFINTFQIFMDEEKDHTYLPDFAEKFQVHLFSDDGTYNFESVEIKGGDTLRLEGSNLYLNNKKIIRYDLDDYSFYDQITCFSFSKGSWTHSFIDGDEIPEKTIEEPVIEEEILEPKEDEVLITLNINDKFLDLPVFPATINYNSQEIKNKRDGSAVIKAKQGESFNIKIDQEGYKLVYRKITADKSKDINVDLEYKYDFFDIPEGKEEYVESNHIKGWVSKWYLLGNTRHGDITIHPHEKEIQKYSLPILSDDKIEALEKAFLKIKALDITGRGGWWSSDYEAIEKGGWSCSDHATITTAFARSYHIPARRVSMAWREEDNWWGLIPVKHAFTEVYIEELDRWVNYDSTRKVVNDPDIYSDQFYCLIWAEANWGTDQAEDVTEKYANGKFC